MRKQYIHPLCSVIKINGTIIMTHVSGGGLVSSTEQEDDPAKAW